MADTPIGKRLRELPAVAALLDSEPLAGLIAEHGHASARNAARAVLDTARKRLRAGEAAATDVSALAADAAARLQHAAAPGLKPVFNLTGTVLHTNLGRAPLAETARAALVEAAGACNVEYDLEAGGRGQRDSHVEALLRELTGAEAAVVVNNNAAAVLLVLSALAFNREVIVSRGELVEIGGSFRMPEVMTSAGCRLHEVGATNRSHPHDYRDAINADTALLMRVHTSNYEIQGFTGSVSEAELAAIGEECGVPLAVDLGSGSLVDMSAYGLPREPLVGESLAAGASVVTFSGDKLLGGPQAGLIVGKREVIGRIRSHPLKRALRCDKLILTALEATLRLYRAPEYLGERLPALRLLARPQAQIKALAERLVPITAQLLGATVTVDSAACASQIGSGSLPVDRLPSYALRLRVAGRQPGTGLADLARRLSSLPKPVIGRIHADALWLDLRCLEDEAGFVANLQAV